MRLIEIAGCQHGVGDGHALLQERFRVSSAFDLLYGLIPQAGRTQEMIYALHSLAREGAIPAIPIYVDSPLAIDATTVFEMHPESFDRTEEMVQKAKELFQFDLLHYTREVEESKALSRAHGPMVIIAASGMAEAGRILHHLAHNAGDPRTTILIVGFMAEHTLGRRLVEQAPSS